MLDSPHEITYIMHIDIRKKETKDATILFWVINVLPFVLILALIVGVCIGNIRIPVA